MTMKARIKWVENKCLMAESGSGHTVILDAAPEVGGTNLGIRPMEMLLIGLGGCTCMDMLDILKKQRQQLTDCVVEITGERADDNPKVFTDIHVHFIVTGTDLKETQVKRAVDLSAEKYCSAAAMLNKTAKIIYDYEIRT